MARVTRTAHFPLRKGMAYDPDLLLEAVENGFTQIGLGAENRWYRDEEGLALIERIGADAQRLGVTLSILTCYQRQCPDALRDHPEWRMVFEDGSVGWEACPFWEEYRDLYIAAMRRIASAPAVEEIQLNDEAHLTDWGRHWGCYCPRCTVLFQEETGQEPPRELDWSSDLWRRWIKWRLENWVRVMREIYQALKATHPQVQFSSQFDPAVCLRGWSPWFSGVDIAALADEMDLLRVDPYHTYHSHTFRPDITFVTEHVRYLRGAMGGKPLRVWTQNFVWPEFSRTLNAADGHWTAVLPIALGAEAVTPYAYPLMQQRPDLARAYREAMRWDRYYADHEPLRHVAIVQGWQTKTWHLTEMREGRCTYDVDYFRPACVALRKGHVLYEHLWDRRLSPAHLCGLRALLLPRVSCLSEAQAEALHGFEGGLVATGDTGCFDEEGRPAPRQALEALVRIGGWQRVGGLVIRQPEHPLFGTLPAGDVIPLQAEALEVEAAEGTEVLATFADAEGHDTGHPAIMAREEGGRRWLYLAFEPLQARTFDAALVSRRALAAWLNDLLVSAVRVACHADGRGGDAEVYLAPGSPAGVEYLVGRREGGYLVTLANYYQDADALTVHVDPPEPWRVRHVYDAEAGRELPIATEGRRGCVEVTLGGRPLIPLVIRCAAESVDSHPEPC